MISTRLVAGFWLGTRTGIEQLSHEKQEWNAYQSLLSLKNSQKLSVILWPMKAQFVLPRHHVLHARVQKSVSLRLKVQGLGAGVRISTTLRPRSAQH